MASGKTQKTECLFTRCPTGGRKKIACIYGIRSEGVKTHKYGNEILNNMLNNICKQISKNVHLEEYLNET